MKQLIFLLCISLLNILAPAFVYGLEVKTCQAQLAKHLKDNGFAGEWRDLVSNDPSIKRHIGPTSRFGRWIYVETTMQDELKKIAVHTQYQMNTTEYDGDCKEKTKSLQNVRPKDALDDLFLAQLASKSKNLVVVVWSPEMAYAGRTLVEIMKLSRETKVPVEVFLDSRAPKGIAKIVSDRYKLPASYMRRLDSFDFTMRAARTHMTAAFPFQNGEVKEEWRGHKSVGEYMELMKQDGML
jgi:hypothetical protein